MKVAVPLRVLFWLGMGLGLSGCAAVAPLTSAVTGSSPSASVEIYTQTSVKLEEGNFVTVRTNVVGSSQGFKLLGVITLYPATLTKAMNRLYAHAEAREGRPETLANLMVEHSGIYLILFSLPKVIARADLVEFLPAREDEDSNSSRALGIRPVHHSKREL